MKKLSILALAAILVIFFTIPAAALENEFGGYWRTRYFSQKYFSGLDRGDDLLLPNDKAAEDDTTERADTRTRLYYTAKINDNLKLVNKFEMDATFGDSDRADSSNYGKTGADGIAIEVMNSYADFNLGPVNVTAGVQNYSLFRDFLISSDASGIIARWKALDNFILAGSWLKNFEQADDRAGDKENNDVDSYTLTGAFWFNENISIKPSVNVAYSDELDAAFAQGLLASSGQLGPRFADIATTGIDEYGELMLWTFGLDFDMTFDKWGLWLTGFGQAGELEDAVLQNPLNPLELEEEDIDLEGWMIAVGGNVGFGDLWIFGDFGLHSEFFYASGDDDDDKGWDDDEFEAVVNPLGSYYWSEIMGKGIFDNDAPSGQPSDIVTNIWAFNLGIDMKPLDKLKIALDWWYAELAEEEQNITQDEDELGHELNMVVTYELVDGLNLDLVGAYLWADDAITVSENQSTNEEDPYEYGVRLSLSF